MTSPRALFARFRREEEGSVILFPLFLFVLMILIGGMAVDMMRFETRRVHQQNTLDSAILAAADLRQTLDPEEVVRDYFEKSGYDPDDVDIDVDTRTLGDTEITGRSITASTRINVPTIFMHMLDVPTLSAPVAGSAREQVQNVEISLVLDISGSMRENASGATPSSLTGANRINDLKEAVRDFARAVLQVECTGSGADEVCVQSPTSSNTTINIIPYAGHVNPGPDMFELLGGSRWHAWSSCKEVTNADFNHADLPRGSSHQLPHFMAWTINNNWMNWGWCPKNSASILYAENDYEVIEDFITNIKLHDGTATHIGMKYGVALLNPSSRDEFGILADRGIIADEYRNRPADFDDDVVKYIVLMTDGRTTAQFRPRVPNDEPNASTTWRDWNYSHIYNEFISPTGGVSSNPSVLITGDGIENGIPAGMNITDNLGDILDRYGSVHRNLNLQPASGVEYGYPARTTYNDGSVSHSEDRNNQNILRMCDQAKLPLLDDAGNVVKADRITVFTIAFIAPTNAQEVMRNCASTTANYFQIENLAIEEAFEAIARTINQLRLTL